MCVPSTQPKARTILNLASDSDTFIFISSLFLGKNRYLGPKYFKMAQNTSWTTCPTVFLEITKIFAVIIKDAVQYLSESVKCLSDSVKLSLSFLAWYGRLWRYKRGNYFSNVIKLRFWHSKVFFQAVIIRLA